MKARAPRRAPLALLLTLLLIIGVTAPTVAQDANGPEPVDRIEICHATSSASNPYRLIDVSVHSIFRPNGHGTHTGPLFDDTMSSGDVWGDIIPAFHHLDGSEVVLYGGLNWPEGQAMLENGCGPLPPLVEQLLTLEKVWLGDAPPPTEGWEVTLSVDGGSSVTLDSPAVSTAQLFVTEGETYSVTETLDPGLPWEEVLCSEDTVSARGFAPSGTGEGFVVTDAKAAVHRVCNAYVPPPPPPTATLTVDKEWAGDDSGEATFEVTFWGMGAVYRGLPPDGPSELSAMMPSIGVIASVELEPGDSTDIPDDAWFVTIDEAVDVAPPCSSELVGVTSTLRAPESGTDLRTLELVSMEPFDPDDVDWSAALMPMAWDGGSFEVTFTNDVTCPEPVVGLAFDKTWEIDEDLTDSIDGLEQTGYDLTFALNGEAVDLDVSLTADDVAVPAGGTLEVDPGESYALAEDIEVVGLPDSCEILTTFSYEDDDLDGSFTVPSDAEDGDVFTIDVLNEVTCTTEVAGAVSVLVSVGKEWVDGEGETIDPPADADVAVEVQLLDADGEAIGDPETVATGTEVTFDELETGAAYAIEWAEVDPLERFTSEDGDVCVLDEEASTLAGGEEFLAGPAGVLVVEAVNAYDCAPEVEVLGVTAERAVPAAAKETPLPRTGVPALLLSLIGLLGVAGGSTLLSARPRR